MILKKKMDPAIMVWIKGGAKGKLVTKAAIRTLFFLRFELHLFLG